MNRKNILKHNAVTVQSLKNNVGKNNKRSLNKKKFKRRKIALKQMDKSSNKISSKNTIQQNPENHEKILNAMPYSDFSMKIIDAVSSVAIGQDTFEWMITPMTLDFFFQHHWEKSPLLIKRYGKKLYDGLLSTNDIDHILRNHNVQFTKNIDVTSYTNGERKTHNLEGRAFGSAIWDFYSNGCSIRMINPQTFNKPVWLLLTTLQEYFKSFCGANVYLTPPDSQGFAPHYDDIEAFILQLEGKKRWRVYAPRSSCEELPRESSRNFGPKDDLPNPLIDVVLEAGDVLYFPRGFIHQGEAFNGIHSLHITISTYQKTSYVDLLEKLLPKALAAASKSHTQFRLGLPLHYSDEFGYSFSDCRSNSRLLMTNKLKHLVDLMMENAPVDEAVDEMATEFMHASLPPVLTESDKICSTYAGAEHWDGSNNCVVNRVALEPDTELRLIRKNCCRLTMSDEDQIIHLYYNVDNSREYKVEEVKYMEIDSKMAPGIDALIYNYPNYTYVEDLPLENIELKITLATGLWERGIIVTKLPLPALME